MIDVEVGKRIKEIRTELGIKQGEFAEKIGSTQSFLSRTEKGRYKPTENMLNLMGVNYAINREWILTGNGDKFGKDYISEITPEPSLKMTKLDLLETIIMYVEGYLVEKNKKLTPAVKAKFITYYYKHFMHAETVDAKEVKRIVDGSIDILSTVNGKQ